MRETGPTVARLETSAYRIPTDRPEADGTLEWDSTTVVLVEAESSDGVQGLGFSYASSGAQDVIREKLGKLIIGQPVHDVRRTWQQMIAEVRNIGLPGVAAGAISAVDICLWDLFSRSLGLPLFRLLGAVRSEVPIYGSGGFTSYNVDEVVDQLAGWAAAGIPRLKMKVGRGGGRRLDEDVERVSRVRAAIGPSVALFVDANGAYTAKQALRAAERFARFDVSYFEEPVSSDRLDQLALVRRAAPMQVAAGEYGYTPWYFERMLAAQAVDVLQADVTRCLGITGFIQAGSLASAAGVLFSAHTAPTIHAHAACAVPAIAHVEWFHDHVRIESMLFDRAPTPDGGVVRPDPSSPGLGIELRRSDAARWAI